MIIHVGEYSEGEENLCSGYCVSFGFGLMPGGWTSNSGGTCYELEWCLEYCLSSSKRGKMLFVVLMI